MSADFDVSAALAAAEAFARFPAKFAQARSRAFSSLSRAIRPEAKRQIGDTYNLKSKAITDRLAARVTGDAVELTGYYRSVGLLNYGAIASRGAGVSVTVFKNAGMQRLKHAFKATGLGGNAQIFERRGRPRVMRKGKHIGKRRQPLVARYGPATAQTLRNTTIRRSLADFAMTKLSVEVLRQLRLF